MEYLHNQLKEKGNWCLFISISLLVTNLLMVQIFDIDHPLGLPGVRAATDDLPTRLLYISDLKYQGSFTFPTGQFGGINQAYTWSFGGWGIAYNPMNNSLIGTGHSEGQPELAGEMSIPALGKEATQVQNFKDPTDGKIKTIRPDGTAPNAIYLGGFLPYQGKLITTAWDFYDADYSAKKSHFTSGLDLSIGNDTQGAFALVAPQAGFVGMYMALVPQAWRTAIGAPALTGMCCTNIISRTSHGPGLFAFDPNDLGIKDPVPTIPLVYYPQTYRTLNQFTKPDNSNPYFNWTTNVRGVVWPENSRTVMFFGRHGIGPFCYGPTTLDPALAGQILPGNTLPRCYDPAPEQALNQNGNHAYPIINYVWLYDALDFIAVKNGTKQPWEVFPYEIGTIPSFTTYNVIRGAAYDPATGRIFLSRPLGVEVFTIANPGVPTTSTPMPTPTPSLTPTPTPASSSTPTPTPTPTSTQTPSPIPTPTLNSGSGESNLNPVSTPTPIPIPTSTNRLLPSNFDSLSSAQKISTISAKISELRNQINNLSGKTSQSSVPGACGFTRNLYLGLIGEDVRCLQKYLNSKGFTVSTSGLGSFGNETNYFGLKTKDATLRWQKAQNIFPSSGYFGPKSKRKYLELIK